MPAAKKAVSAYLVTTPNPEYSGTACGISFHKGRAVVTKETLSPSLGLTVVEVVEKLRADFGYTVAPLAAGEVEAAE